jgi:hypothetical protein
VKLTSKIVPYSSNVGGGLVLLDEIGRAVFQVAFMGTTQGITKEQTAELSRQFDWYVNELGLEIP